MKTIEKLVGAHGSALVVLSGGQDSVTCLGWALRHYDNVAAIGFRYGQSHEVELECAAKVCADYGVSFVVHDIPSLSALGDSALVSGGDVNAKHARKKNLPASFVPNRNALFLTIAHAYAQKIGADTVVTGVCQTDYSGYPDCRADFIFQLSDALNTGYETSIRFATPLMYRTKAQTFEMAAECGKEFLQTVITDSHTCYNGDREHLHEWGHGCDNCPACHLRKKGWEEFK